MLLCEVSFATKHEYRTVPSDVRIRHSFYNKYKQLEAIARSGKKGLWKAVSREQLPEWLKRKRPK